MAKIITQRELRNSSGKVMRALDRGETFATQGRKARGRRAVDLLIAATALAEGLPLYTRNPSDIHGLASLLDVGALAAAEEHSSPSS